MQTQASCHMTTPAGAFRRSLAFPNHTPDDRVACPIGVHHRWCFDLKCDGFTGVHSEIAHFLTRAPSLSPYQIEWLYADRTFGSSPVHAHDEVRPVQPIRPRVDSAVPPRIAI